MNLPSFFDLQVGLAKDHEQVARAGLLEKVVAHGQVGVHVGGENGQLTIAFGFLRDVRVEGETTNDEQVEPNTGHGFLDLFGTDGAEFGTNADGDSFSMFPFLCTPRKHGAGFQRRVRGGRT